MSSFINVVGAGLIFAISSLNTSYAEAFKAGSYSAVGQGLGGDVTVTLDIDENGAIKAAKIDAPDETPELGGEAAIALAKTIVEKQSVVVDGWSGATITSEAILEAADKAYSEAKTQ